MEMEKGYQGFGDHTVKPKYFLSNTTKNSKLLFVFKYYVYIFCEYWIKMAFSCYEKISSIRVEMNKLHLFSSDFITTHHRPYLHVFCVVMICPSVKKIQSAVFTVSKINHSFYYHDLHIRHFCKLPSYAHGCYIHIFMNKIHRIVWLTIRFIYLNASQYDTLFSFTLFSCLK